MTGRNLSDYLLKTRDSFYKRRYGGFEFGVRNPVAARNFTQLQQVKWRLTYRVSHLSVNWVLLTLMLSFPQAPDSAKAYGN